MPILIYEVGVIIAALILNSKYSMFKMHLLAYQPASTYVIFTLCLLALASGLIWYGCVETEVKAPIQKEDPDIWSDVID